jgi:C-terminal processing protease CtpA/Prc
MERDRLTVLHVMRGGPAAAAGWRVGERICRIDGQPIGADYPTSALAKWSIGKPGTMVRLGMCDGTVRTLTLKRFY